MIINRLDIIRYRWKEALQTKNNAESLRRYSNLKTIQRKKNLLQFELDWHHIVNFYVLSLIFAGYPSWHGLYHS